MLNFGIAPIAPGRLGIVSGRFTGKTFLLEEMEDSRYKLTEGEPIEHSIETLYA